MSEQMETASMGPLTEQVLAPNEAGDTRQVPFDQEVCHVLRQAASVIFARHPEARSVAAVVDYFGALNDANIQKGIWVSPHGPVDTPDGVFGSMFQQLRMLEEQFARAIGYAQQLREDVQSMATEAVALGGRNEQLRKEIAAQEERLARATAGGQQAAG